MKLLRNLFKKEEVVLEEPKPEKRMAVVVELNSYDPLKAFDDETNK